MSEERVEQVARAIFESDAHTHGGLTWDCDDLTDWERDVYRSLARAAIAVMLVDVCPLCNAARGHWHGCGYGLSAPVNDAPQTEEAS